MKAITVLLAAALLLCPLSALAKAIEPQAEGAICEIARAGEWTVYMGYGVNGQGTLDRGIVGQADGSAEAVLLVGDNPIGIVPCGDSFVYYGGGEDGRLRWRVAKPLEEPRALPLTYDEGVFYGDSGGIWYTKPSSQGITSYDLYRMALDGTGKKRMGTVRGDVVGVLEDKSIVVADYHDQRVLAWKDGASTVLYDSTGERFNAVVATHDSVWVVYGDHFGRIAEGVLRDQQEGYAMFGARSGHQLALLVVEYVGAGEARVMLMNDSTRSYAELDVIPFDFSTGVDLRTDCIVIWGTGECLLQIPGDPSAWTPYRE